jgi:glycosyltransferase involved in cell wall biosynthesis
VPKPQVSVIVVVYNIPREAPRTLYSLSAEYQRDIAADDYEVIVVDNGSNPPFDAGILEGLAGNFRLIRLDPAPPSPAHAINVGLAAARGDTIGVMIDGARMVTPGLLHFARAGVALYPRAVVSGLGGTSASTSRDGPWSVAMIAPARMRFSLRSDGRRMVTAYSKLPR